VYPPSEGVTLVPSERREEGRGGGGSKRCMRGLAGEINPQFASERICAPPYYIAWSFAAFLLPVGAGFPNPRLHCHRLFLTPATRIRGYILLTRVTFLTLSCPLSLLSWTHFACRLKDKLFPLFSTRQYLISLSPNNLGKSILLL
jgi:hypothetical protein